jgi:hypothetical protein
LARWPNNNCAAPWPSRRATGRRWSPLAATLLGIAALALIVPLILRLRGKGQVLTQIAGDSD